MEKYRLLHEAVLREGVIAENQLTPAPIASVSDLLLAHDERYVQGLLTHSLTEKELRPIGLTWSPQLLERSLASTGGFVAAAQSALQTGFSGLLAGGTHHAHKDRGEGYCVFNDFAVAALKLINEKQVSKILIIDLDVHQGNGNSSIMGMRDDVFIFSMHGEKNYPFRKIPSHLDIALTQGCDDETYLSKLKDALSKINFEYDVLFYQAGVDNLKEDTLGTFNLSLEGLIQRDSMIFEFAKDRPIALAIGGGYAKPIELTVQAHVNTFKVAKLAMRN
jgi:acetoin utilization deacetylase AcuC-like enzyme